MRNLAASDRSALIRLASSLPKGDENRRAILAGLNKVSSDLYEVAEKNGGEVRRNPTGSVTVFFRGKDSLMRAKEFQKSLPGNLSRGSMLTGPKKDGSSEVLVAFR